MAKKFEVQLTRSVTVTVEIDADSAEQARDTAMAPDYPVPPIEEWHKQDDWVCQVFDQQGNQLIDEAY